LHDKRIKALKLGLESGYKLRAGKRAYKKAYKEYKAAYIACETAIVQHEIAKDGPMTMEQESALITQLVIEETVTMEKWQFQLVTEAQSTRRGRAAMWLHRQGKPTKLALGVAASLTTGGIAGLAGGLVAGVGIAVAKVARSQGTRQASGLATQGVYEITDEDRDKYKGAESSGQAFDMMYADQKKYVDGAVRKKRTGVLIAGLGFAAGALAGNFLNDQLGSRDKSAGVRASGPNNGGVAGSNGGTGAETAPRIGGSRRVSVDNLIPRGGSAGAARIDGGLVLDDLASGNGGGTDAVAAAVEQAASHVDTSGVTYPWEYFGNDVHDIAARAAADHNIQWHGQGINAWIEVDGRSDTDFVVNTLAKYQNS